MFDLGSKPQLAPSAPHVNDRARHLRVPALVAADRVELCETEKIRDCSGIDEVVHIDPSSHW
jgi:hypothetical protein